ncbi:hypothetical protein BC936DRAFT_137332 [Jimgerdemannia flammicorona]|uniref:Sodium/calcium exchanger membrane region domain-containing protein n=1 Tax=Jimgerdemannia flammicorona TaxID=994334 RepID=A0A433CXN2_9FUNG|nr:hypothetical protein BC936DRAFT_137332 [Jimgerdemannia flammicorona]
MDWLVSPFWRLATEARTYSVHLGVGPEFLYQSPTFCKLGPEYKPFLPPPQQNKKNQHSAMKAQSGSLAIGELIGAASFIASVVAGSMAVVAPFRVSRLPFLRDLSFFMCAILIVVAIVWDGKIYLYESVILIAFYAIYVAVVVVGNVWWRRNHEQRELMKRAREGFGEMGPEALTLFDSNRRGGRLISFRRGKGGEWRVLCFWWSVVLLMSLLLSYHVNRYPYSLPLPYLAIQSRMNMSDDDEPLSRFYDDEIDGIFPSSPRPLSASSPGSDQLRFAFDHRAPQAMSSHIMGRRPGIRPSFFGAIEVMIATLRAYQCRTDSVETVPGRCAFARKDQPALWPPE